MKNNAHLAISAMSEMPQTKSELEHYCSLIESYALDGNMNVLEVAEKINMMGRIVDFFEKNEAIQYMLLNEVEKFAKGELSNFQVKETGTKYFYSSCGHSEYNRLLDEKKALDEKLKAIEQQLKVGDVNGFDSVTGEVFEAKKAVKQSKSKVIITLKN
jgi:hypothetical protein